MAGYLANGELAARLAKYIINHISVCKSMPLSLGKCKPTHYRFGLLYVVVFLFLLLMLMFNLFRVSLHLGFNGKVKN